MTFPKELITVTTVSRSLAMFLFIAVPFVGFLVGLKYQQQFAEYFESRANVDQYILKRLPTATQSASTASPAPNGDRANWKTYINRKYNYSLKYPNALTLEEEDGTRDVWINKQIFINVADKKLEGPCGDCPNYNGPIEEITVANIRTEKYSGEIGAVGGNIPQKFQEIQLENSNLYYTITLYALKYDAEPPEHNGYYEIQENDKQLFDQILSTFRFTDQ